MITTIYQVGIYIGWDIGVLTNGSEVFGVAHESVMDEEGPVAVEEMLEVLEGDRISDDVLNNHWW